MEGVAFMPLARSTFDISLAEEMASAAYKVLSDAGYLVHGSSTLLTAMEGVTQELGRLAVHDPVLTVIFQATFADSTLVNAIADISRTPLLLWAVPEHPDGGRLKLNSFCGINLAAHSLTLRDYPFEYLYAMPSDQHVLTALARCYGAAKAFKGLHQARLGVIGEHPPGMDSCHLDVGAIESKLGVDVLQLELDEVFRGARAASSGEIEQVYADLNDKLENLGDLDRSAIDGTLSVFLALESLTTKHDLGGMAVRCWPEFFTDLGCAACGAMSMLTDERIPCSCEADANGTLTQMILGWLSGESAFGTDMVSFDLEQDTAILWHCGLAPLSMADPQVMPRGTLHSNRNVPLVMEFPLKPGRVTLARLSRASGSLTLVVGAGEMIAAPLSFSGTSGVLRFDRPVKEVLDVIMKEGLEHHISLTYGDHLQALITLAEWLDLPVARLT